MVNNQGNFGFLGNRYFEIHLEDKGYDSSSIASYKDEYMVDLALRDATLRIDPDFGGDNGMIRDEDIQKYHFNSLDDLGLPRTSWGGAFLDVFGGAGSSMDLGGFDSRVDVNQSSMIWALLTNDTREGVNAREAFWALNKAFISEFGEGIEAILDRGVVDTLVTKDLKIFM